MRYGIGMLAALALTVSAHAQTVGDRYDECLKKQVELTCSIEVSSADIKSEIATETKRINDELAKIGPVTGDFARVPATFFVVGKRLQAIAEKAPPEKGKEILNDVRLSNESGEVAEEIARTLARSEAFKAAVQSGKLSSNEIKLAFAKTLYVILPTTDRAIRLHRRNTLSRLTKTLTKACAGKLEDCGQAAMEVLDSQETLWSAGFVDVQNSINETAADDLLALNELYEMK